MSDRELRSQREITQKAKQLITDDHKNQSTHFPADINQEACPSVKPKQTGIVVLRPSLMNLSHSLILYMMDKKLYIVSQ